MQRISVSQFKARCLKLFSDVKLTGRSLLITKNGDPIAIVSPPPPELASGKTAFGVMASQTTFVGDIISPIGPEDWEILSDK